MSTQIRLFTFFAIIGLVLAACTPAPKVEMTIQADTAVPYNSVGQVVKFSYTIKNTGTVPLPGIVTVSGDQTTVTCPNVNTFGNQDNSLDVNETILCTADYTIIQADLDRGSVTNIATANVSGTLSNQATLTIVTELSNVLTLTKSADPLTYDQVGQLIIYTYAIKNTGAAPLGPTQFVVNDSGISTPINCGEPTLTLAPAATVTCSATYTVTQADMDAPSVSSSATASGAGAGPSQQASATITRSNIVQPGTTIQHLVVAGEGLLQIARCYGADPNAVIQANPQLSSLGQLPPNTIVTVPNKGSVGLITGPPCVQTQWVKGETIQHTVVAGEWLWQIARCYGADPKGVIQANSQLPNPAMIKAGTIITVPNIGSVGTMAGPPCVEEIQYTVQAGDTWNSIAQKFNADPTVLQMTNSTTLTPGRVLTLKVPHNSAGGTSSPSNLVRISFAQGATSATQSGIAPAGNLPVRYVLNASQGQVMTVKLTPQDNSVNLTIFAPNGSSLKAYDFIHTWSGTLPENGEYRLDVANALGTGANNVPYTLEVSITGNVVNGKIQVGEQSTMGGKAGLPLNVKVKFEASSSVAGITAMRVKQSPIGLCLTPGEMDDASWENFVLEKTYTYTPPINWSTFKLHVQYRDAQGNLSPVYCGEVAMEGTP